MQEKIVFQNSLLLKDFFIIDKRAYIKYNISTKGVIYMKSFEEKMNSLSIVKTSEMVEKFSKDKYYKYLKENNFCRIAPGMYALQDAWIDNYAILYERCPKGVISHDAALYYYGLIDREPTSPTMTIYSGYNASRLKKSGYKVYFVKKEYLNVGKVQVVDFDGNEIPMYNLERTICDMIRNRSNFEVQDFNTALKSYVRLKDKKLTQLFEYAKLFRVEKILRGYLEILL